MEKLRLYGFWRSIATYRVRVALRLKGLDFEETSVNILAGEQFSDSYARVSALRAVPTLEIDGRTLTQSLAIMEYLEETRPGTPLLPADPGDRAETRALALVTIADAHPLMVPRVRKHLADRLSLDPEGVEDWARHWLREGLATFERIFAKRPPAPFAFGSTVSLADIAVSGHAVSAGFFGVALDDYPQVKGLVERLASIDAFAASHPDRVKAQAYS